MGAIDVEPRWHALVLDILCRPGPRPCRVWAFGCRVRGRTRRFSDLDLAFDAGRPLALGETAILDDLFESDLPWRVDLVACSDAVRRDVESHAVPFATLAAAAPSDR